MNKSFVVLLLSLFLCLGVASAYKGFCVGWNPCDNNPNCASYYVAGYAGLSCLSVDGRYGIRSDNHDLSTTQDGSNWKSQLTYDFVLPNGNHSLGYISGRGAIAMSDDGRYMYACNFRPDAVVSGWCFRSTDYGRNFNHIGIGSSGVLGTSAIWSGIDTSSDGKHVIFASQNTVYLSDDFGATSRVLNLSHNTLWDYVYMSPDGREVVVGELWSDRYYRWVSLDGGATWNSLWQYVSPVPPARNPSQPTGNVVMENNSGGGLSSLWDSIVGFFTGIFG